MTTIFISWGSPDRAPVESLASRLKSSGLDVFFSDEDMHAGEDPNNRVKTAVRTATVSLFALSDQSVERPWIRDEIAWAAAYKDDPNSPLQRLIPVIVGELTPSRVPRSIRDEHLHHFDLTDVAARELRLQRLLEEILELLGGQAPIVVPAALLAMNLEQFRALFERQPQELGHLITLCMAAGMDGNADHSELTEKLAARYGPDVDSFQPFVDQLPLLEMIEEAMADLNEKRGNQRPIFLRWDHQALLSGQHLSDELVESRRASSCLTIVDSISAFDQGIRAALLGMPVPREEKKYGLVWVPPYFHRADEVLELTKQVTRDLQPLHNAFVDWQRLQGRWVAFDTGTQASLKQWLWRAVSDLASDPDAIESNVHALEEQYSTRMQPNRFFAR